MVSRSNVGIPAVLAFFALLAPAASDLAAQDCHLAVRMGGAIPLDEVPRSHGRSDGLTGGPALGVGPSCGGHALTYGGEVLFQSHGRLELIHALGGIGHRFRLGDDAGAPWIRLDARAGMAFAFDLGGQAAIIVTGRPVTALPGAGFALGGGFWLGLSAGPGDFVVGTSPLLTFLQTEIVEAGSSFPRGDGFTSLVSLPIVIGYEFRL